MDQISPDLLSAYDYHLPTELIAQQPTEHREASRLLLYRRADNAVTHGHFPDVRSRLRKGDVLVLNDTKVFRNRLFGIRASTGGKVEVFLLEPPLSPQMTALTHSGGKLRVGEVIEFPPGPVRCTIVSLGDNGERTVRFNVEGDRLREFFDSRAQVPLPPYIHRSGTTTPMDEERYQTVYARNSGAVAAPTAGLHFTPELLDSIRADGITTVCCTLHVGRGTFEPVKVERLCEHKMHSEYFEISEETCARINEARAGGGRVIPVGTTSVRMLESSADERGIVHPFKGRTEIFIRPPYRWKACDALITNFHLPKSTLLMLVAAFVGLDEVHRIYGIAVEERYRFFSYGDAMFLE
ncbi:MAG: tRNA preQ1(34) S-adenosylmethionine ribosyltransferase-isomerase QueA [Candidatus Brocadiia bacterium]